MSEVELLLCSVRLSLVQRMPSRYAARSFSALRPALSKRFNSGRIAIMTAPVSSFADQQTTQPNGTSTTSVAASTSAPPAASNGLASITKSAARTTALGKANIKQSSKLVAGNADKLDVWSIFTPANMPPDAINLGQGFMNWKPPQWVRDASQQAMNEDVMSNHYSHPRGRPRLLNAISKHYSPQFQNLVEEGRQLKPEEIVVTAGANEGMFAALLAFLEKDDEVICIEPFFDQYLASIIFNGGKPVYVPLHPPETTEGKTQGSDWKLDLEEFEKAFTSKTKVVIINTPHNPSGKCFTKEELTGLAEICTRHNVLVLADEVVCRDVGEWVRHDTDALARSTTVSPMTEKSTSGLPHFQACGTARSLSDLPASRLRRQVGESVRLWLLLG